MRSFLTVACSLVVVQGASAQGMYYPNPYYYQAWMMSTPHQLPLAQPYGYGYPYYVPSQPMQPRTPATVPPSKSMSQPKPTAKPESKPSVLSSKPADPHNSVSRDKEAKAREAFIRGQRKVAEIRTLVKFEKKTLQEALKMVEDGLKEASAKERVAFEQKKEFLQVKIDLQEAEWKERIDLAINEMKGNVERIFPNAQWKETPDGPSLVFPK